MSNRYYQSENQIPSKNRHQRGGRPRQGGGRPPARENKSSVQVQVPLLSLLRKEKVPVTLHTSDGKSHVGTISAFDYETILLDTKIAGTEGLALYYKHALVGISTQEPIVREDNLLRLANRKPHTTGQAQDEDHFSDDEDWS